MKPIGEYNFREIVGKFVIIDMNSTALKNLDSGQIVAYCYIDIDAGISFSVYGSFVNNTIVPYQNTAIRIRYSESILLDVYYEIYTRDMDKYASNIDRTFIPKWGAILDNKDLDVYRDKIFPYDMLMMVATLVENEFKIETLWVRPTQYNDDGLIFAKTIEQGEFISKGADLAIMSNEVLGGTKLLDLPDMVGITPELANCIVNKIQNKGGINEE